MKRIGYIIILLLSLIFVYCRHRANNNRIYYEDVIEQDIPELKSNIFNVIEHSELYIAPNDSSAKLINPVTTEKFGALDYYSIDSSCKVEVTDSTEDWYKIHVIEPYWLQDTHNGWVRKKTLETPDKAKLNLRQNIDYHFLKKRKNGNINNLYFSYYLPFDEVSLLKVAHSFKETHCPNEECNIYIYDTKDLIDIVDKYPLDDKEYLELADHFIYSFDLTNSGQYYPFQDIHYKELGGNNWKKTPIQ